MARLSPKFDGNAKKSVFSFVTNISSHSKHTWRGAIGHLYERLRNVSRSSVHVCRCSMRLKNTSLER